MKKSLIILLLGLMLCFAFVGCTEDKEKQVGDTTVVVVDGDATDSATSVVSDIEDDTVKVSENSEETPAPTPPQSTDSSVTTVTPEAQPQPPKEKPLIVQKEEGKKDIPSSDTASKGTDSSMTEEEKKALLDGILKEIEDLKE